MKECFTKSCYYDPEVGRFINADGYVSTGQGVLGNNMFAYCGNNAVNSCDPNGNCFYNASGKWCHDNWEFSIGFERKPDPALKTSKTQSGKNVYITSYENNNYFATYNSIRVIDMRSNTTDPNIKIIESYKIVDVKEQTDILNIILDYNEQHPTSPAWERTLDSMVLEWDIHNEIYDLGWFKDSTADVDLNNNDEGKGWFDFAWERGLQKILPF